MLMYGVEWEVIFKVIDVDGSCVLVCVLVVVYLLIQKKLDFEINFFFFVVNKNLVFLFVFVWFEWFLLVFLLNGEQQYLRWV